MEMENLLSVKVYCWFQMPSSIVCKFKPLTLRYQAKPICARADPCPMPTQAEWEAFCQKIGLSDKLLRFVPALGQVDAKLWETENQPREDSSAYELGPVTDSASFRYWPSAQVRGQRPIGEFAVDTKQEDHILAALVCPAYCFLCCVH